MFLYISDLTTDLTTEPVHVVKQTSAIRLGSCLEYFGKHYTVTNKVYKIFKWSLTIPALQRNSFVRLIKCHF